MILSRVERSHIRCDQCSSAYAHVEGVDVRPGLADAGWVVEGSEHICPRCVRRAKS